MTCSSAEHRQHALKYTWIHNAPSTLLPATGAFHMYENVEVLSSQPFTHSVKYQC